VVLIGDNFSRPDASLLTAGEMTAIRADIAASKLLRITAPDATATALLAPYKKQKEAMGSTVVATTNDNLCLRRCRAANVMPRVQLWAISAIKTRQLTPTAAISSRLC